MFITFLKFTADRARASGAMAAHNAWIAEGFAAGKFLCVGTLDQGAGGAILSQGEDRAALEARIAADPFVAAGIVTAEIHEIDAKRWVPALDLLLAPA
ncbi:MAG: hypothetical protein IE922_12195 [Sphingomonadales bacterium]|nr:hypothetical protein [Sphingomonadales bacterium]